MTRYVFFCPFSLDSKPQLAAKNVVRSVGAQVVRVAPSSMLVQATPSQLRKLEGLLPDWRCTVERKTARLLIER